VDPRPGENIVHQLSLTHQNKVLYISIRTPHEHNYSQSSCSVNTSSTSHTTLPGSPPCRRAPPFLLLRLLSSTNTRTWLCVFPTGVRGPATRHEGNQLHPFSRFLHAVDIRLVSPCLASAVDLLTLSSVSSAQDWCHARLPKTSWQALARPRIPRSDPSSVIRPVSGARP
jgi:hypothetical protein